TELVQAYLKATAVVIKPSQLLNENPAKLRHMMVALSFLVLILAPCMFRGLLTFEQFGDDKLMRNFFFI
ncbi:hypothetical protein ACQP3L_37220, partial [Escherichia coli]